MNDELNACRRIAENEGLGEARRLGLVAELFPSVEGKKAFEFISEHARKHGVCPTLDTIKNDAGVAITDLAPEPLSYYAEKLFSKKICVITGNHTRDIISKLQTEDGAAAVASARRIIGDTLQWQFGRRSYIDPRLTIDERVQQQIDLEKLHGMVDGFKTPWPELDIVTRGMHPGELWVLVAAKKTGKSFGCILFMRELIKQGLKPLMVTMEMSSSKIIRRFDAMYSTLDFGDFRSGLLGIDGIDRYIEEMKRLANEGEFWIAGDGLVKCPADIETLVHDLNPDVVLIDGVYLMQPSTGHWGSKYEKVSTVVDELQPMAHRVQKPFLMTTQFNRQLKQGALVGDASQIGYAYELVQNCLPGDSLISTDAGIVRLDSTVGKTGLRVWNGQRSVSARVVMTGKKQVYEIHLDNGQIVRASKDHRFLVLENGHTSWVAVEDIRPGDAVCRAKPLMREPKGSTSRIDERRIHGRDIKLPFEVDASVALILGILTGDGWVADERQWSLSGHADDSDVIAEFDRLLLQTFGVKFSAIRRHRKTLVGVLACRELARHAYSVYGLTKGIAHQKEVPSGVLSGTPDVWRAFLRGLFETDGHVSPKAGHVMLTSVSSRLAYQSAELLQSLGIDCSVFPVTISRLGRHRPYRVLIANSGIAAFSSQVGFVGRRKQTLLRDAMRMPRRRKWAIPRSPMIATVVEVTPSGKTEMMYDVLTDSAEHMFWVDGLLAHNCDVCLAMYRDEDLKSSKRMLISIMEHREGEDFTMLIRWDLNEMNFEFVRQVQASELVPDKGGSSAVASVSF